MLDSPSPVSSVARPLRAGRPALARRLRDLDERWIVTGLILTLLLIAMAPTAYGYLSSTPERHFQGIVYGVADTAQYFSWLRDHRTQWLVSNRMTPEANSPALFNLLWLVVGRVQFATGLDTLALFHGVRVLAGAALLFALYPLCALFTRGRAERLTAYLVITLGSGLGWIWVVVKHLAGLPDVPFPFDLYVAEPNTLFILAAFPHFTIATTLIVGVFWCFLEALRKRGWRLVAAAALLGLTLTLQHAYDLLIITLVPAGALALMLLRDRRIPWFGGSALLAIGLVALPPPLYFTWLTSRDPLWGEVLDQFSNAGVFTPPPHHLLILMGVPLVLVVAAIGVALVRPERPLRQMLAAASDTDLFLWNWLGVGFGLLYIPTDFQIHMLNAWQIPVGLIAVRWLYRRSMPAAERWRLRLAHVLPALLVAAVLPTSIYLISWRMLDLGRQQAPFSLAADEVAALRWLGDAATRDDVVLGALTLGQFVPVYSDARTFLGHWAQTVRFYDKQGQVRFFFDPATPDAQRRELLEQFAITYVFYGEEERSIGGYDPGTSLFLEPAFTSGATVVYRVR